MLKNSYRQLLDAAEDLSKRALIFQDIDPEKAEYYKQEALNVEGQARSLIDNNMLHAM